jgi:hypothetical protein
MYFFIVVFAFRNRLRSTSPAPLDERYLQCTVPWYEAIFEAQGIAAGNAALAVPLIMGVLLPFLFLYMKVIKEYIYMNNIIFVSSLLTVSCLCSRMSSENWKQSSQA